MNTCIYQGWVRHRRFQPRYHGFRYHLALLFLDLDELDRAFTGRWFWSAKRFALARFRREDHFGDPKLPLERCVRDLVEKNSGRRPQGPIRLLTNLRYFGYCFNPISIYYCFDAADKRVDAIVAEVTNTPWGERCCYVLEGTERRHRFRKTMHVSPFMPMDLNYDWRGNEPGRTLAVHMNVLRSGEKLLDATLVLERRPLDGRALAAVLARCTTFKVITTIYWEALRLWLKRTPVCDHPTVTEARP